MDRLVLEIAAGVLGQHASEPIYLRLADALAGLLGRSAVPSLPSARRLAAEIGVNRATTTAAYRELARRGFLELRPGRCERREAVAAAARGDGPEPPRGALDLARYAPDRELLPAGAMFEWLGLGEGEGEAVAQYGDPRGYPPLREWLRARLGGQGVHLDDDQLVLTSGVQHALDLLLRATTKPGDGIVVEDPTYPGLPPLLSVHGLRPAPLPVGLGGADATQFEAALRRSRPRLAVLTPTLQNPTGAVMSAEDRQRCLELAAAHGVLVVEEHFDPGLVTGGTVPVSLAACSPDVVLVGSFSKALFPGLRVGWLAGPPELVRRVADLKLATDLSGSTFLEAAAFHLCRRGVLDRQLVRLRAAAAARTAIVTGVLEARVAGGVRWSRPRGGFSLLLALPSGWSSEAAAARAAAIGVWVLPGPALSVSRRDDVLRLAFAAVGGEALERGVAQLADALVGRDSAVALV